MNIANITDQYMLLLLHTYYQLDKRPSKQSTIGWECIKRDKEVWWLLALF